MSLFKY